MIFKEVIINNYVNKIIFLKIDIFCLIIIIFQSMKKFSQKLKRRNLSLLEMGFMELFGGAIAYS